MKRLLYKWALKYLSNQIVRDGKEPPAWNADDLQWESKQVLWLAIKEKRTPKEEAEMIIRRIKLLRMPFVFDDGREQNCPLYWNIAYRASVKLVEEILKSIKQEPGGVFARGPKASDATIRYWEQVRKELETYK